MLTPAPTLYASGTLRNTRPGFVHFGLLDRTERMWSGLDWLSLLLEVRQSEKASQSEPRAHLVRGKHGYLLLALGPLLRGFPPPFYNIPGRLIATCHQAYSGGKIWFRLSFTHWNVRPIPWGDRRRVPWSVSIISKYSASVDCRIRRS